MLWIRMGSFLAAAFLLLFIVILFILISVPLVDQLLAEMSDIGLITLVGGLSFVALLGCSFYFDWLAVSRWLEAKNTFGELLILCTHAIVPGACILLWHSMETGAASGIFFLPLIILGLLGYGVGSGLTLSSLFQSGKTND